MIPNLGSNFEISEDGNSIFPPCLIARRAGRRYAPFAIHGFGHCGFCLFRCSAQEPNWGPTEGGESLAKRTDKIRRFPARRSVGAGGGNIPFPCSSMESGFGA